MLHMREGLLDCGRSPMRRRAIATSRAPITPARRSASYARRPPLSIGQRPAGSARITPRRAGTTASAAPSNPANHVFQASMIQAAAAAARSLGLEVSMLEARDADGVAGPSRRWPRDRAGGLDVMRDPALRFVAARIASLAVRHRLTSVRGDVGYPFPPPPCFGRTGSCDGAVPAQRSGR